MAPRSRTGPSPARRRRRERARARESGKAGRTEGGGGKRGGARARQSPDQVRRAQEHERQPLGRPSCARLWADRSDGGGEARAPSRGAPECRAGWERRALGAARSAAAFG